MMTNPLTQHPIHWLAFGFGSGLAPKAPGTVGTVFAILPWLLLTQLSDTNYLVLVGIASLVGIYICGRSSELLGVHDHKGIVWDEFCGLWIALYACPLELLPVIVGFGLFRFFDIVKPWPISWCDKELQGGLGIMLDDVIAGLFAWVGLQLILPYL
jgi:phosphatidylglycerophosphatase A